MDGRYKVIPYSNKINWALARQTGDAILYLDNGSMPHPRKVELMAAALEANPEWGAVYCGQHRTGYLDETYRAGPDATTIANGNGQLNYTQVMHRPTSDRWTLDMAHADPDIADGLFWQSLHRTLGPFHPVGSDLILDEHHMADPKAVGV